MICRPYGAYEVYADFELPALPAYKKQTSLKQECRLVCYAISDQRCVSKENTQTNKWESSSIDVYVDFTDRLGQNRRILNLQTLTNRYCQNFRFIRMLFYSS